jgi:acyl-coenzyme A thioesterase PaaI-like protein
LTLTHHDLCFGCGLANVFGLHLEAEPDGEGAVSARFFVKQDHQGPPGAAHGGVMASGLDEAMALAVHGAGVHAVTVRLEVVFRAPAPVGEFVRVTARIDERDGELVRVSAAAVSDRDPGRSLAAARGEFKLVGAGP